ncbi:MAG TPA: LUD domain-containing protein [Ohtaekwangia sp.]|uniref:LutC/YkgG family protein n=1 Tax=Ohtaekwangia sp. TaxID=2066019 RepID=UPI002F91C556
MESRDKILNALKKKFSDTPAALPVLKTYSQSSIDLVEKFEFVLRGIGGRTVRANTIHEINEYIRQEFADAKRIVSLTDGVNGTPITPDIDPHTFADVDLIILQPHFAVAENAAAWITAERMGDRALPFIAQHIALVVYTDSIVHTMHDAYNKISNANYPFGTFIAGPSKTADIEQSLVLGAHGPKSMTVFLISK